MSQTLLVADDSLTIQRVIQLALADQDLNVVAVTSGEQAIEQIESNPPALVLADTRMPDRSGYEIAEFLNSRPSHQGIPVVLMTGAFEPLDERRAKAAGCVAVLVKPFEPGKLVRTVQELLGSRPAPAAHPSVKVEPQASESDLTWPVEEDAGTRAEPAPVSDPVPVPSVTPRDQTPPAIIVTDELVDRLATRVIARLSDRVVRETTTDVVSRVAERLVREEIERLKDKLR